MRGEPVTVLAVTQGELITALVVLGIIALCLWIIRAL